MIVGTGIDIIEVERIRKVLEKHSDLFLKRVFTDEEMALAPAGPGAAAFYAGRWAAKEAVSKTLGTGIGAACGWTDICILRRPGGAPYLDLRGDGAETARKLGIRAFHISISHIKDTACAVAVAEG